MEQVLTNYYPLKSIQYKTIIRVNISQSYYLSSIVAKHKTYTKRAISSLSTIPALMGCFLANYYHLKSMHHEEEESRSGC